jgi:hypothetical protein
MGSDNSVTPTSVTVGLVTSSYAEIKTGLTEGQTVVTGTTSTKTSTTTTNSNSGVNLQSLTGNTGGGAPQGPAGNLP